MDQLTRDRLTAAGIGAFVVILFVPALGLGFLSDDFSTLKHVAAGGGLEHPAAYFRREFYAYYRPVVFLSHALDWSLWGPNAAAFHATNVVLHALNAVALFLVARRFSRYGASLLAALAFAVHPTNHESVFWVAGRVDLLPTAALLFALWLLGHDQCADLKVGASVWSRQPSGWRYWLGVALFAVALFGKESGIALLLMAAAYDVFLVRRGWQQTLVRLMPLFAVVLVYVVFRSGAGLEATGGRAGKVAMLAGGIVGLLWMASSGVRGPESGVLNSRTPHPGPRTSARPLKRVLGLVVLGSAVFVIGFLTPLGPTIGFAWYAAYFLGPLAWIPADRLVVPGSSSYLAMGTLVGVLAVGGLVWMARRWRSFPALAFALAVTAAGLLPVSAMPSRNHLFPGTVGAALVLAACLGTMRRWTVGATLAGLLVVAGSVEAVIASRDWRRASVMTNEAVALIGRGLEPCGARDVLLLIAPAEVRGVPCNINDDAFRVALGCVPGRLRSLLRVVGGDVTATASVAGDRVRLRVPGYRGNLIGTTDLRRFVVQLPAGRSAAIDTPIGRLTTWADGDAQLFEIAFAPEGRAFTLFYYSDGAVRRLGGL